MSGSFGSDSEIQALKTFLHSAERTEKEARRFITDNFEDDDCELYLVPLIFDELAVDAYEAAGATIPRRPGFGLVLNPNTDGDSDDDDDDDSGPFPRLSFDGYGDANWRARTLLIREVCMLRVVEELTNKPKWWLKVKEPEIAAKWKTGILEMDWKTLVGLWAVFTEGMADAIIAELRAKADLYQETGLIPVMDYSACVIKSDNLMTEDLMQRLRAAVAPLENVPEEAKDWHPGSDGQVLNLVDPSMWPLVYGQTRVLPNKTMGVADCLQHAGTGFTLPVPAPREDDDPVADSWTGSTYLSELSTRFQWLPCDVALDKGGKATIASYINNVHPVEHASLYAVIEEYVNLSLLAWAIVYRWPDRIHCTRIHWHGIYQWKCQARDDFCKGACDPRDCPLEEGGIPRPEGIPRPYESIGGRWRWDGDECSKENEGSEYNEDSENNEDSEDSEDNEGNEGSDSDKGSENNDGSENDEDSEDYESSDEDKESDDGEGSGDDGEGINDDFEDKDDDLYQDAYWTIQPGDAREQWFARNHTMIMPNPSSDRYCDHFAASSLLPSSPGTLFGGTAAAPLSALQVIVQLTTIHLTPDKPRYDGGEWRVEGQLNEHIVATALFFYDADNVTNGALAFRTAADREKLSGEIFYENGDLRGIERAFAINAGGSTLQDIGEVSVRPGRALFYPNLYQHRVGPFALADPTRPGHRKVLALHLVDPRVPVLSTANVPPQQRAWWAREVGAASPEALLVARGLPGELRDLVLDGIGQPISREEAREIREDLMADHKALAENNQSCWDQTEFHFIT